MSTNMGLSSSSVSGQRALIRTVNGSSGSCGISGMVAVLGSARGINFAFV